MRSIPFSQVLFDALQYSGNDRNNISDETFAQFRDFLNSRLREAWESQEWKDLCRVAEFTTTVDANNVCSFIPAEECGDIFGVYNFNPLTSSRTTEYTYSLYDDGTNAKVVLESSTIGEGWYYYRVKAPILNGVIYNPITSYSAGAQIYFDSGSNTGTYIQVEGKPHYGNFYTCIISTSAGENPTTAPTKWKLDQIPYAFSSYMAWGAGANWYASEGMMQEAGVMEQKAIQVLDAEVDKIVRQQKQIPKLKFTNPYR
jgi:hypothetical protein